MEKSHTQTNILLPPTMQRAFRHVNTKIEAKKKILQQRLQEPEYKPPESVYNESYY